jgi:hypothetical protein
MIRLVLVGFVAGFLAVLTFHQATIGVMNAIGLLPNPPFRTNAVGPLAIPAFVNQAFWGGIWGIVIMLAIGRIQGIRLRTLVAILIGALGATAIGWFVVAPLKGLPVAQGWNPAAMWRGPLINGMFGLGAGIIGSWLAELTGRRR